MKKHVRLIFIIVLATLGFEVASGNNELGKSSAIEKITHVCVQKLQNLQGQEKSKKILSEYVEILTQLGYSEEEIALHSQQMLREVADSKDKKLNKSSKTRSMIGIGACVVVGVVVAVCLWNYWNKKQYVELRENYNYQTPQGNNVAISLVQGDITQQQFPNQAQAAIVNAANEQLAQGGGVCGAIFNAAGAQVLAPMVFDVQQVMHVLPMEAILLL
jgi:hypothetical protein